MGGKRRFKEGFHRPFERLPPPAPAAAPAPAAELSQGAGGADDDAALFLRAVAGAQPLPPGPAKLPAPEVKGPRRLDDEAQALIDLQDLVAGRGPLRVEESEEVFSGAAPGVSRRLMARLRRGHFAVGDHLDLHGMVRMDAHREVANFVIEARRRGLRCVLVITGRGRSSPGGEAVLRQLLPRWLSRAPIEANVLAFCTARATDGGPGAYYLLLRRSDVPPFARRLDGP